MDDKLLVYAFLIDVTSLTYYILRDQNSRDSKNKKTICTENPLT